MARLAEEGLTNANPVAEKEHSEADTEAEQVLERVYKQYRQTRATQVDEKVESVLSLIEDADVQTPAEAYSESVVESTTNTEESVVSTAKNPLLRVFELPGNILNQCVEWFRSGTTPGNQMARVAVPVMALAVTSVLIVSLVNRSDDLAPGGGGITIAAHPTPASLLEHTELASLGISMDAEVVQSYSPGSSAELLSFDLGRRLFEVSALLHSQSTNVAAQAVVSAKLTGLAGSMDAVELQNATADLALRIVSLPNEKEATAATVAQVRGSLLADESESSTVPWVTFGEGMESLAAASRLAQQGDLDVLAEALRAFNAGNFADTVPNLPSATKQLLQEINQHSGESPLSAQEAQQVRQLATKLILSLG